MEGACYRAGVNVPEPAAAAPPCASEEQALTLILERLRPHTSRDLGAYTQSSLLRRVRRRSELADKRSLQTYLEYLNDNVDEIEALAADLSVLTTSFFRDPNAWAELQGRAIGPLVEAATPEAPLRAWVIGCSTGEEAYTLAMLIDEEFENRRAQRNYLVFASDIDQSSIAYASAGCYPPSISSFVPSVRLKRYFQRHDGQYRVCSEVRRHVVFAVHDVLEDSPIARLNLVSCRNLLIYLKPEQQGRLIGLIRRACLPGGYLFLGNDDGMGEGVFCAVDATHRIFAVTPGIKFPHEPLDGARSSISRRRWRPVGERARRAETLAVAEEELQSAAVELQAISNHLKVKLDELARANSNLEVLIDATDAGMIFLDRKLNVTRMTSRFAALVGVHAEDVGPAISRYAGLLEYADLAKDALRVVTDGIPVEHWIERRDGRRFGIRIQPYRGAEYDEEDGAVVAVFPADRGSLVAPRAGRDPRSSFPSVRPNK